MSELIKMIAENGIGVALAGVIAVMFYKVLMHILKQQENVTNMAALQNERWQKTIDEQTSRSRQFNEQSNEAHRYQREEHAKIIEYLGKLCERMRQ